MLSSSSLRTALLLSVLILLAALSRLLPHWPNFTAVGAMALCGAAYFPRRAMAWIIPFVALYLSDLLLNNWVYAAFYPGFTWQFNYFVYGAFALIIGLGMLLRGRIRWWTVLGASLTASGLFYLLTNFGAWLGDPLYTKDATGLLAAYAAGLPFFWNTLAGDLFFCGVLFGSLEWLRHRAMLPAVPA